MKTSLKSALLLLPVAAVLVYMACSDENPSFRYAAPERGITLPADHASHPDYQNEWWYYTGHLRSKDGRRFGFQLTWFRVGLTKEQQEGSKFKTNTFYFAHFTVTDKDGKTFHHAEKSSRGGGYDDAGADTRVLRTWIGDWRLEGLGPMFYMSGRADSMALSLIVTPKKAAVLQGEKGYSRKGDDPSNASMYYSMTRLGVVGVLTIDGAPLDVEGEAWMDHEFGTTQLGKDQIGWDWFSLQLANNEEIMLYGLRRADGSYDPNATGAYIKADGTRMPLAPKDYTIEVLERWTSPHSKASYPAKWKITIPSVGFEGIVTPYVADQELRTENSARVTYWEGAASVEGKLNGQALAAEGYVELTGYAGALRF
jgi:predicted secreted hydrolase